MVNDEGDVIESFTPFQVGNVAAPNLIQSGYLEAFDKIIKTNYSSRIRCSSVIYLSVNIIAKFLAQKFEGVSAHVNA